MDVSSFVDRGLSRELIAVSLQRLLRRIAKNSTRLSGTDTGEVAELRYSRTIGSSCANYRTESSISGCVPGPLSIDPAI